MTSHRLEVGASADFTLFDSEPEMKVRSTIVHGEVVYAAQ
jgi:predicted amidohydrolase YtcJ